MGGRDGEQKASLRFFQLASSKHHQSLCTAGLCPFNAMTLTVHDVRVELTVAAQPYENKPHESKPVNLLTCNLHVDIPKFVAVLSGGYRPDRVLSSI